MLVRIEPIPSLIIARRFIDSIGATTILTRGETDEANFRLADAKLTRHLKVHFAVVAEARAVVEPTLRAWELDADLRQGHRGLRFQYAGAELVDRTPALPGTHRAFGHLTGSAGLLNASATVAHVPRQKYPEPPGTFRMTPDVESLWYRYRGCLEGREPLLAMAYFCFTVLEIAAGAERDKLRKAAAKYNIEPAVLKKLSELSSHRGDPRTARKMPTPATPPLSGSEEVWIRETIKQLIRRVGDQRSVLDLPTLTMADLPPL